MSDRDEPASMELALPEPPAGWLESALAKLHSAASQLSAAKEPDEVMRLVPRLGRELFGFQRIGCWIFESGRHAMVGTFGIDDAGAYSDERHLRVFDRTGSIARMMEAWEQRGYYAKAATALRSGVARVVGRGIHVTAPLITEGEVAGFMSVDDLLGSENVNRQTGRVLNAFADLVSGNYFQAIAKRTARRSAEQAQRAERVKVEFLGMMSHEVRTPLNAIMGFSQLLCAESEGPHTQSLARTIEENGDHLTSLINGMLDYAQLSGSDLRDCYEPSDPEAILASTVASFMQVSKQAGVSLRYEHKGDSSGLVRTDPVGFRQIVTNLLQNAIKFTPPGGQVEVILQTQAKGHGFVEFFVSVRDTGIGMDPEKVPEIFKPFKQLDSSLTRKVGGVGMGLAIVERLTSAMEGTIECRSSLGEGTAFDLDFVFELAEKVSNQRPETWRGALAGEETSPENGSLEGAQRREPRLNKPKEELRLLVAEDHLENLNVLVSMLQYLGYPQPATAADGAAAKAILREEPFDLAFFDINMPLLDGLALTAAVRAGECGPVNREVIIVGVSATALSHDREQCLSTGMNEYLLKPLKINQLQGTIDRLTANSSAG